jgi:hypothetical protein
MSFGKNYCSPIDHLRQELSDLCCLSMANNATRGPDHIALHWPDDWRAECWLYAPLTQDRLAADPVNISLGLEVYVQILRDHHVTAAGSHGLALELALED